MDNSVIPSIAAVTLGCKANAYDTEAILGQFRENGYKIVNFDEKADVYIINTCSVTATSDKKSRQMIRRAVAKNPGAVVAVTGCYVQTHPEEAGAICGVSVIVGVKDRYKLPQLVNEFINERGKRLINGVTQFDRQTFYETLSVNGFVGRHRAFIKIQDGCDNFCAYCLIPFSRGPARSRSLKDIRNEAKVVAKSGIKEIVVTGICIDSYGNDFKHDNDIGLLDVLYAVAEVDGIERIRVSSVNPVFVDDKFIKAVGNLPKICPHFHLSLQSGCDRTLRRMNRNYTTAECFEAAAKLRNIRPDTAICVDVIAGFPGETDEDFSEVITFFERLKPAAMHVFPYSSRPGTAAANFPEQVDKSIKASRVKELIKQRRRLTDAFIVSMAGSEQNVLFEKETEHGSGIYEGFTTNYIPVRARSNRDIVNKILVVKLGVPCGEWASAEICLITR